MTRCGGLEPGQGSLAVRAISGRCSVPKNGKIDKKVIATIGPDD
jgi:hypothetical protein